MPLLHSIRLSPLPGSLLRQPQEGGTIPWMPDMAGGVETAISCTLVALPSTCSPPPSVLRLLCLCCRFCRNGLFCRFPGFCQNGLFCRLHVTNMSDMRMANARQLHNMPGQACASCRWVQISQNDPDQAQAHTHTQQNASAKPLTPALPVRKGLPVRKSRPSHLAFQGAHDYQDLPRLQRGHSSSSNGGSWGEVALGCARASPTPSGFPTYRKPGLGALDLQARPRNHG